MNWADWEYGQDQENLDESDSRSQNDAAFADCLCEWAESSGNILHTRVDLFNDQATIKIKRDILSQNCIKSDELIELELKVNEEFLDTEHARRSLLEFDKWYIKNLIGKKEKIDNELLHLKMIVDLARFIADKCEILDIDGIFSETFPSASDLTVLRSDGVLVFIDITSQEALDGKLAILGNQASIMNYDGGVMVVCMQFIKDKPSELSVKHVGEQFWEDGSERVTDILSSSLLGADNSELELLRDQLREILSPCLTKILPQNGDNHNDLDKLKDFTEQAYANLLSILEIAPKEDLDLKREKLRRVITGRGGDIVSIYCKFMNNMRTVADLNADAKKFIYGDFDKLLCLSKLRGLQMKPPVSLGSLSVDVAFIDHRVDYMFWVCKTANELCSNEETPMRDALAFYEDGTVSAILGLNDYKIPWNYPQTRRTRFPLNVVAYVKPVVYDVTLFRKMTSNGMMELSEKGFLTHIGNLENQEDVDTEKTKWTVHIETKVAKHFQLLFNPKYTDDDNFLKFLSRHDKIPGDAPFKKFEPMTNKMLDSVSTVSEFVEKSMYSLHNIATQRLNSNSTINKMLKMAKYKVSPNMLSSIEFDSTKLRNGVFDYIDSLSVHAKAFTAHVGIKHPANSVVFLNTGSYSSWSLWYLPGTYPHFNSTWRKLYSISEIGETPLFEPCKLKGSSGTRDNHDILRRIPKEIYKHLAEPLNGLNHGIDKFIEKSDLSAWKLNFTCSAFKSIDKNNLEWELELMPKVLLRSHSLCELRNKLYNDMTASPEEVFLGEKEIALGALLMCINSQQHSVQSTAYRYLHQALNSRDFDPYQIVNKILDTRCKSHLEVFYVSRMLCIYKMALLMRLHDGIEIIRSENKEVCVAAPDFLIGTSSPVLNKASYNKPNSFNKEKQYRVSSEADCVKALWDQVDDLRYIKENDFEAYIGMPIELYKEIIRHEHISLDKLGSILEENTEVLRLFTDRILLYKKVTPLSSNFWFEFWALLQLRLDFQTVSTKEILSGKPINELLTIKGSTTSLTLSKVGDNVAKRKVTAVCVMLQRLENENPEINDANTIVENLNGSKNFDMLTLSRKILSSNYLRDADMICQFSEKDAPGKSREISTLNIEFGVLSLMNEIVASKFSEQVPEDLITHSSKEEVIYKNVTNFEKEITSKDTSEVIYVNQDKSRFGPNRKNSSMLLTGLMISKDLETYSNFSYALFKSSKRKVAYPHEILKQSLDIRKVNVDALNKQLSRVKQAHRTGDQCIYEHGFTSAIMNEILKQYYSGNEYGPAGTFYAEPVEGMAGQGIGGIISSIQHAALSRLASEFIQSNLKWKWKTFVTSDDSLTCIVYPKSDSKKVHNGIKNFISRFNYLGGLIENLGKFTASSQGNEMNGFFILNGEPIVSVWKFGIAYSSLQTSGNIGEDLLSCVSKCNDLYRRGGSYYLCSILGLTLMTFVLDAYRLWSCYSFPGDLESERFVWELPPEILGIPVIDPVTAIISPIGTRISSIRANSLNATESLNYIRFLLESSLTSSRYDQTRREYESENVVIDSHIHTVDTIEGTKLGLNARLPPTVNGLIGALNRRNYDTRLAMEIGEIIKDHHGKPAQSRYNLRSILCSLTEALQIPVKHGTTSRSVFDQFKDVAHSPNHAFMKVSDNSFFPKEMKGRKLSLNDLRNFIKDRSALKEMRARFIETISSKNSFTPAVDKLLQFLIKESNRCKIVSDYMWSCNLSVNRSDFDYDESKREKSRFKNTRRRLLALYPDATNDNALFVNFDEIKAELYSRYAKNQQTFDKGLRYIVERTYGDMEDEEALVQCDNTVSRLKALMPVRQLLYTESPAGVHDRSHDLINWLRMNAKDGFVFSTTYKISEFAMGLNNNTSLRDSPINKELDFDHEVFGSMFLSPSDAMESAKFGITYNPITDIAVKVSRDTVFKNDGNVSIEAEQLLICGRSKMRLEWSVYVSKISKLPTSTWYGNAHYRVKFKGIRTNMHGNESCYLTGYTIKKSFSKLYTHLIVVFCNNKALSMKIGSKSMKTLEDFKKDLKFAAHDTEFDSYQVVFLDKYSIFRLKLLGARTFLSIKDGDKEFLTPTIETWSLNQPTEEGLSFLMNIKEFQEAHLTRVSKIWEPTRKKDIRAFSSLKLPITNWSKGHEADFENFIDALENLDEQKLDETPIRFRLALLDVFSSFMVDGDVEGLKDMNSRYENNDNIHDAPGSSEKTIMAGKIATWILDSKYCFHQNYARLYSLWSKFEDYFDKKFRPMRDVEEILEWHPHHHTLGDEEGINHSHFIQDLGSATSYDLNNKQFVSLKRADEENPKFSKLEMYLAGMIADEENTSQAEFNENLDILERQLEMDRTEDEKEVEIPANFMELMLQMTQDALNQNDNDT